MSESVRFRARLLIIADKQLEKTVQLAQKASKSRAPVLICGESGTGKELIAQFIHEKSPLKDGPFVSINCAAVPEGLVESEFFGFERGAFTGAIHKRIGKFEQANGGSFLLDEISEMPIQLQAKLLRVLQEGEFERLGGVRPTATDARIIATTNREPTVLIREGRFREDLFYRLNVIRIDCAPLRGRADAIRALVAEFLAQGVTVHGLDKLPQISPRAMDNLIHHTWPGNIRELKNVLERAMLVCEGDFIDEEHLSYLFSNDGGLSATGSIQQMEESLIKRTLHTTGGNQTEAARRLGITSRTLRNKLKVFTE